MCIFSLAASPRDRIILSRLYCSFAERVVPRFSLKTPGHSSRASTVIEARSPACRHERPWPLLDPGERFRERRCAARQRYGDVPAARPREPPERAGDDDGPDRNVAAHRWRSVRLVFSTAAI
jgi:hypothetical protein